MKIEGLLVYLLAYKSDSVLGEIVVDCVLRHGLLLEPSPALYLNSSTLVSSILGYRSVLLCPTICDFLESKIFLFSTKFLIQAKNKISVIGYIVIVWDISF